MTTFAYYGLHYGKEWLFHSMRSVVDFVDRIYVFYTPIPSHGHTTEFINPDREAELYDIALQFNAVWYSGIYGKWEGQHRDFAVNTCADDGADIVMVVDSDEIWDPFVLTKALEIVDDGVGRNWRVSMRHFWRSLGWICDDGAMPVRFIKPKHKVSDVYVPANLKCWHMGYAQSERLIRYKMSIHGHKNEIRPNWFSNIFQSWEPGMADVHPTNVNFWDPKPFDREQIVHLAGDHPYYNLAIIK
jgi:hypothetical protein